MRETELKVVPENSTFFLPLFFLISPHFPLDLWMVRLHLLHILEWCSTDPFSFSLRCGCTSLLARINGFMHCEWTGGGCSLWRSHNCRLQSGIDASQSLFMVRSNSLFRSSQTATPYVPKTWTDLCSNSSLWSFQHAYWSFSKWSSLVPSIFHSMISLLEW